MHALKWSLHCLKAPWIYGWFCCFLMIANPYSVSGTPALWNLPPQNPRFVGREELLQQIKKAFHHQEVVVITGGPGFGKSQLAKQFAYLNDLNYDAVWWFKVDETLSSQFEKIAEILNQVLPIPQKINLRLPSDLIVRVVKERLRQQNWRCLFIFDSTIDFEALAPYFLAPNQRVHFLATTRKRITPYQAVPVDKFTRKESLLFTGPLLPQEEEASLKKLAAYLSDHPLALATAASFLALHPNVSVAQYITSHDLQKEETSALVFVDQHEQNLYITLKIILEALARENSQACTVLKFLTLLHSHTIPFPYLTSFLKCMGIKISDTEVLSVLYDQSLIDVQKDNIPDKVRLSMHDLIHDLINRQIPATEKKQLLEKAIAVVSEAFDERPDRAWRKMGSTPEHLLHAQNLFEEAATLNYVSVLLLSLKIRVLNVLLGHFRDFEKSKILLDSIQSDEEKLNKQTHFLSPSEIEYPEALSLHDQALLEANRGFFAAVYSPDYERAIHHEKKALEILEKIPDAYEEKIRNITNLAQSYLLRGDLSQGEQVVQKGIKLLPHSNSDVYNALFSFAWALLLTDQGKCEEAAQVIDRNHALFPGVHDHPAIEIALFLHKAEALAKIGQKDACLAVLAQGEKITAEFFCEQESNIHANLMVIRVLNMIGDAKETPQSITSIHNALAIYERVFHGKDKHRKQGLAYFILGQLYEQQSDLQKAREAYLKSDAVYNAILKEKALDDVSRLYSAIAILGFKLKDTGLARLYLQRHVNTFGLDHPRTVGIFTYADAHDIPIPD